MDGASAIEVVEPAYVDGSTSTVIRLGRARRVSAPMKPAPFNQAAVTDGVKGEEESHA